MKTLAQYLKDENLTQAAFAARVGVKQATVSKLCAGKKPSLELACRIDRETKGAVPPAVWFIRQKAAA